MWNQEFFKLSCIRLICKNRLTIKMKQNYDKNKEKAMLSGSNFILREQNIINSYNYINIKYERS